MTMERRHDIDWLRVIAIGLLVIYHAGIIFQPWAMLVGFIRSEEMLQGLWKPMAMLNVWRIPFLFYVSGMGVYFAMRKRTWAQLLLERFKRILVPFVFGLLAIVPLHFLIFQEYYNLPLGYYAHPAHLWFLGNIFAYVLILLPLLIYLKKIEGGRSMRGLSIFMSHPVGPISISVFFIVETVIVRPQVFEMYAQTSHGFFLGFLAFFFGFLFMSSGKTFWKTVLKWRWLYLAMAVALYFVRLMLYDLKSPGSLMAVESNCWILAVFGFGYRYLNKPSNTLNYLSQAAYPVYIIHMFALYVGAMVILPVDMPVTLKFLSISVFTFTVCYLIYEFIIRRTGFLRPLFGLKWTFSKSRKAIILRGQMSDRPAETAGTASFKTDSFLTK